MFSAIWLSCFLQVQAAPIPLWNREDFPASSAIAGTDGWVNGYAADTWAGTPSGRSLIPLTDDNGGTWGQGDPVDNWIIRGESFSDGGVTARIGSFDDDTIGVVLAHDGDDSFYLAFFSKNSAPPPIDNVRQSTIVLLRLANGSATVLGRKVVADLPEAPNDAALELRRVGSQLGVFYNNKLVFGAGDPTPLGAGKAGAYAYDAGGGRWDDPAFISSISAYLADTDDDFVANDEDNCIDEANEDQRDADADGIGDACDPTPGTQDSAEPDSDEPADSGVPQDTNASGDTAQDPDAVNPLAPDLLRLGSGCGGCTSGPLSPNAAWLVLGLLPVIRRKRAS